MRRGHRGGMFGMSRNPLTGSISNNASYVSSENAATYGGVTMKSTLLLVIMFVVGGFMFQNIVITGEITPFQIGALIVGPIVGLISVIVGMRSLRLSQFFALLYAAAQGLSLGVISGMYEVMFGDGIVATAVLATGGVFLAMLFLYRSGLIKVTAKFRAVMLSLLIGYLLFSIFFFIFSLIGIMPAFGDISGLLLVVSVFAAGLAALFLLIDFDNISQMVEANVDKRYEWLLSLSLLVTLVWLYLQLLRILAILASRNRN